MFERLYGGMLGRCMVIEPPTNDTAGVDIHNHAQSRMAGGEAIFSFEDNDVIPQFVIT
jgi:hypothetical protein